MIEGRLKKVEVDVEHLKRAHDEHRTQADDEARKSSESRRAMHEKYDALKEMVHSNNESLREMVHGNTISAQKWFIGIIVTIMIQIAMTFIKK
jgi:hypothetical protein